MSAGIPASPTGTNLFSNLPHVIVSSSPTSITGLLQQHLSSTAPVSNSSSAYSFGYPAPNSFLVNPYFAAAAAAVATSSPSQGPSAFAKFLNPEKQQHQRITLKRTWQRVDAGESRNTYTSFIPTYQKTPIYSTSSTLISRPPVSDSVVKLLPVTAESVPFFGNQSQNSNQPCDLLKKMHLDGIGKEKNASQSANGEKSISRKQYQPQQLNVKIASNATNGDGEEDDDESDHLLLSMTTADFYQSDDDHEKSLNGDYDQKDDYAAAVQTKNVKEEKDGDLDETIGEDNELNSGDEGESVLDETEQMEMQRIKRMQGELMYMQQRYIEALAASQQQQQKQRTGEKEESTKDADASAITPLANGSIVLDDNSPPIAKEIKNIFEAVKSDLYSSVSRIVDAWMERMQNFLRSETARLSAPQATSRLPQHQPGRQVPTGWPAIWELNRISALAPPFSATGSAGSPPLQPVVSQVPDSKPASANVVNSPRPPLFFNPFFYKSFPYASADLTFAAAAATAASGNQQPPSSGLLTTTRGEPTTSVGAPLSTIFPSFPPGGVGPFALGPVSSHAPSPYLGLNLSQKPASGALANSGWDDVSFNSLPVVRKKRRKVMDTRVVHLHQCPFPGASTGLAGNCDGRGSNIFDNSDLGATSSGNLDGEELEMISHDPSMSESYTFTPLHLRKAKLMFFYTRYPSSQLLKAYFPDIRFNNDNTAQLVKWFSNFREFYYVQMEKYARQASDAGVTTVNDIHVDGDSELYKALTLHYDRNNHIEVPPKFRLVVESTLKEFFLAIQAGRDANPSWKKEIYKVITRLDDPIPEYFKTLKLFEKLE